MNSRYHPNRFITLTTAFGFLSAIYPLQVKLNFELPQGTEQHLPKTSVKFVIYHNFRENVVSKFVVFFFSPLVDYEFKLLKVFEVSILPLPLLLLLFKLLLVHSGPEQNLPTGDS